MDDTLIQRLTAQEENREECIRNLLSAAERIVDDLKYEADPDPGPLRDAIDAMHAANP